MRELRTSNAHRLANVGLGMGLGMGLGNEVIFCHRSSPFESLDVTRTHLEVKRLGNLWLKKKTLTKETPRSRANVTNASRALAPV